MFSRCSLKAITCWVISVSLMSASVTADEPHRELGKLKWQEFKDAGKRPTPVFSKDAKSPGWITVSGQQAKGSNHVVAWTPTGWCQDCTWPLSDGDVLFNVGDAGTPVRVAGFTVRRGEAVIFENGRIQRYPLNADGRSQPFAARLVESVRGWTTDSRYWLAVSVPAGSFLKECSLDQCELRSGETLVGTAVGVVPPPDARGSLRGELAFTRDGAPLLVASHRLSPAQELDNLSEGTMRIIAREEIPLMQIRMHQFGVDQLTVVGGNLRLMTERTGLFISASNDISLLSEYGWKVGFDSPNSVDGIRFRTYREATIELLFVVDGLGTDELTLDLGDGNARGVVVAD